jgi:type III pantothenate kinase
MLVVDVGNTRVKWATWHDGRLTPQRAAEHAHWTVDDWERQLFDAGPVERVAATCVAGAESRRALVEAAARRGVDDVCFVISTAEACGVRNAYPDPRLLGVDRWAAVIGAWHLLQRRACCVVDVGTAATIDAVRADGTHLGGFIVPGPHMMGRSLHAGTRDLAAHTADSTVNDRALFADNTRDAIERGCRVTLAALVDRAHAELARIARTTPTVVVTGGAAEEVLPYVLRWALRGS